MKNMFKTTPMSLFLLLLFGVSPLKAQFLNRLQKEVQRSVENAVIDKASEAAAKKTREAMDKMLEEGFSSMGNYENVKTVSRDALPDSYSFDWIYRLAMETEEGDLEIVYRLRKNASYFGTSVPSAMDMLMVLDPGRNIMVTYMENDGSKMATAFELPKPEIEEGEEEMVEPFTFKKTGNTKEILGYTCEEIVGENEEYKYSMFHTTETEISFNDLFRQDQTKLPEGVDEELFKEGVGMMMEMEMINKSKPKDSMKMRCVDLSKKNLSINNDDYQFFAL